MNPGWNPDVSFADYLEQDALSSSGIKRLLRSQMHYLSDTGGPAWPTANAGRYLHNAILRKVRSPAAVYREPDLPANTKAGKAAWRDFFETVYNAGHMTCTDLDAVIKGKHGDRTQYYSADMVIETPELQEMADAVLGQIVEEPLLADLIDGDHEVSGLVDFNDVLLKVRPDILCRTRKRIIDVKTVQDAARFPNDAATYRYDIQAAFYIDVANAIDEGGYESFFWVVIEKTPPYGIMTYVMSIYSEEFESARAKVLKALKDYRMMQVSGPKCYDATPQRLELPKWYR